MDINVIFLGIIGGMAFVGITLTAFASVEIYKTAVDIHMVLQDVKEILENREKPDSKG